MFIDTHAHLSFPQLAEDQPGVIRRAVEAGVTRIVDVGTNAVTSWLAVEAARIHQEVFASAGFHPHESESADDKGLEEVRSCLTRPKVVAVGETGLDFFHEYAPHDLQERLFRKHIVLATEFGLPLIIHSRGAEDRVIDILNESRAGDVGGVLHCFGGSVEQVARAVDGGFYLGFGGSVTFKKSTSLEAARSVPVDRLIFETDCPYLAPVPFRGKRNEPAYVRNIAEFLVDSWGIPLGDLAQQTTDNASRLFNFEV
ncbi:MAG: TatD family hydrolase [Candidatus Latescibacterota bacterium]|nr:TatD family hydrolase [Candidatus Latescibacterota bacterium]